MKEKETAEEAPKIPKAAKRHKVLVAEDNPVVRKGLNNFLVKWGYEPIEADNGDTAWNTLETDPSITLAILDWNIPGLSGMQVCQRIRMRTNGPYVYTVIFSARSSIEEQVLALEGGADDYLIKPAKPSLLRARLGVGLRILALLAEIKAGAAK
ncbi:MAG: response regulator transcription factor [Desulfobulbaceae bacterium]|nr:response regulator transcription factor [Desulfobulbaceae bacterium]HIJ90769.1 response regulator transcription factor [Deltaproteobacteria bacterium]